MARLTWSPACFDLARRLGPRTVWRSSGAATLLCSCCRFSWIGCRRSWISTWRAKTCAGTASWPSLCWYAHTSRAGIWLGASGGLEVHPCMRAGAERVLGQQWSSRHRGGRLPRTHLPVLRPGRGRFAHCPLAMSFSHWVKRSPPCNISWGCKSGFLCTGQRVAQVRQAPS